MSTDFEERSRKEKAPIQYKVYKGIKGNNGALRFNLKRPYLNQDKKAEGVIFLDMAPAIGPNEYDWKNQKIKIALSITDIPKIILYLRNPKHTVFSRTAGKLRLTHDKEAGTARKGQDMKTLEIAKSETTPNFMFSLYRKLDGETTSATVPVSPDEAIAIGTLLQAAIPIILSWTEGPYVEA